MKGCKTNDYAHGMYEYVRGTLKHKHKLERNKKETYLPFSTQLNTNKNGSTQLNEYLKVLKTNLTY